MLAVAAGAGTSKCRKKYQKARARRYRSEGSNNEGRGLEGMPGTNRKVSAIVEYYTMKQELPRDSEPERA